MTNTDLFKEKSEDWDSREHVKKLSRAVGQTILQKVALNDEMDVLDFGAGTGLICSQIAPHVHNVLALDISQSMLDKIAAKPELQDKVEICCQNILSDPLSEKFDLIVSAMAMHHVEDTPLLLQRFSEHLKAGGQIALADLDKEEGTFHPANTEGVFHFGFEREALKGILTHAGFEKIQFYTAHTIEREDNSYPIFLVTAQKI